MNKVIDKPCAKTDFTRCSRDTLSERTREIRMDGVFSPAVRMLGGSIMIKVLLAAVIGVVLYVLGKVIGYCWKMHRTFRNVPSHPNTHWLWGHAHLV